MKRKRPVIHLSLSPDTLDRLTQMATRSGETRSCIVDRLVRGAEMPRPRVGSKPEK